MSSQWSTSVSSRCTHDGCTKRAIASRKRFSNFSRFVSCAAYCELHLAAQGRVVVDGVLWCDDEAARLVREGMR